MRRVLIFTILAFGIPTLTRAQPTEHDLETLSESGSDAERDTETLSEAGGHEEGDLNTSRIEYDDRPDNQESIGNTIRHPQVIEFIKLNDKLKNIINEIMNSESGSSIDQLLEPYELNEEDKKIIANWKFISDVRAEDEVSDNQEGVVNNIINSDLNNLTKKINEIMRSKSGSNIEELLDSYEGDEEDKQIIRDAIDRANNEYRSNDKNLDVEYKIQNAIQEMRKSNIFEFVLKDEEFSKHLSNLEKSIENFEKSRTDFSAERSTISGELKKIFVKDGKSDFLAKTKEEIYYLNYYLNNLLPKLKKNLSFPDISQKRVHNHRRSQSAFSLSQKRGNLSETEDPLEKFREEIQGLVKQIEEIQGIYKRVLLNFSLGNETNKEYQRIINNLLQGDKEENNDLTENDGSWEGRYFDNVTDLTDRSEVNEDRSQEEHYDLKSHELFEKGENKDLGDTSQQIDSLGYYPEDRKSGVDDRLEPYLLKAVEDIKNQFIKSILNLKDSIKERYEKLNDSLKDDVKLDSLFEMFDEDQSENNQNKILEDMTNLESSINNDTEALINFIKKNRSTNLIGTTGAQNALALVKSIQKKRQEAESLISMLTNLFGKTVPILMRTIESSQRDAQKIGQSVPPFEDSLKPGDLSIIDLIQDYERRLDEWKKKQDDSKEIINKIINEKTSNLEKEKYIIFENYKKLLNDIQSINNEIAPHGIWLLRDSSEDNENQESALNAEVSKHASEVKKLEEKKKEAQKLLDEQKKELQGLEEQIASIENGQENLDVFYKSAKHILEQIKKSNIFSTLRKLEKSEKEQVEPVKSSSPAPLKSEIGKSALKESKGTFESEEAFSGLNMMFQEPTNPAEETSNPARVEITESPQQGSTTIQSKEETFSTPKAGDWGNPLPKRKRANKEPALVKKPNSLLAAKHENASLPKVPVKQGEKLSILESKSMAFSDKKPGTVQDEGSPLATSSVSTAALDEKEERPDVAEGSATPILSTLLKNPIIVQETGPVLKGESSPEQKPTVVNKIDTTAPVSESESTAVSDGKPSAFKEGASTAAVPMTTEIIKDRAVSAQVIEAFKGIARRMGISTTPQLIEKLKLTVKVVGGMALLWGLYTHQDIIMDFIKNLSQQGMDGVSQWIQSYWNKELQDHPEPDSTGWIPSAWNSLTTNIQNAWASLPSLSDLSSQTLWKGIKKIDDFSVGIADTLSQGSLWNRYKKPLGTALWNAPLLGWAVKKASNWLGNTMTSEKGVNSIPSSKAPQDVPFSEDTSQKSDSEMDKKDEPKELYNLEDKIPQESSLPLSEPLKTVTEELDKEMKGSVFSNNKNSSQGKKGKKHKKSLLKEQSPLQKAVESSSEEGDEGWTTVVKQKNKNTQVKVLKEEDFSGVSEKGSNPITTLVEEQEPKLTAEQSKNPFVEKQESKGTVQQVNINSKKKDLGPWTKKEWENIEKGIRLKKWEQDLSKGTLKDFAPKKKLSLQSASFDLAPVTGESTNSNSVIMEKSPNLDLVKETSGVEPKSLQASSDINKEANRGSFDFDSKKEVVSSGKEDAEKDNFLPKEPKKSGEDDTSTSGSPKPNTLPKESTTAKGTRAREDSKQELPLETIQLNAINKLPAEAFLGQIRGLPTTGAGETSLILPNESDILNKENILQGKKQLSSDQFFPDDLSVIGGGNSLNESFTSLNDFEDGDTSLTQKTSWASEPSSSMLDQSSFVEKLREDVKNNPEMADQIVPTEKLRAHISTKRKYAERKERINFRNTPLGGDPVKKTLTMLAKLPESEFVSKRNEDVFRNYENAIEEIKKLNNRLPWYKDTGYVGSNIIDSKKRQDDIMDIIKKYKEINIGEIVKKIWETIESENSGMSIKDLLTLDLFINQLVRVEVYDENINRIAEDNQRVESLRLTHANGEIEKLKTMLGEMLLKKQRMEGPMIVPFIYALRNLKNDLSKNKNVLVIEKYQDFFQRLNQIFCASGSSTESDKLCAALKQFSATDTPSILHN